MPNAVSGTYLPIAMSGVVDDVARANSALREESLPIPRPVPTKEETAVRVAISADAGKYLTQLKGESLPVQQNEKPDKPADKPKRKESRQDSTRSEKSSTGSSNGEKAQLSELQQRDSEVRTHEQQHMASAGSYAMGGIKYDYEIGPDGHLYAVGGHVDLDTSAIPGNPEATIRKAQVLRASALAVGDPSSADAGVAQAAVRLEMSARAEIAQKQASVSEENTRAASSSSKVAAAYGSNVSSQKKGLSLNVIA